MTEAPEQLTLVAFLERKPPALAALLADCRARLTAALGASFRPYAPEQIHATIVGLERAPGSTRDNANLLRLRGRRVAMDLRGFLDSLRRDPALPLAIRFGGLARGARPFASRGRTPWERSFSFQGDLGVLIGWPAAAPGDEAHGRSPLDALRRRAGAFGILHAYHASPEDVDDDLYLRLGSVLDGRGSGPEAARVETALREALAAGPVRVPLTVDDLRVAVYRDPSLPPRTTRALTLDAACAPGALEALCR